MNTSRAKRFFVSLLAVFLIFGVSLPAAAKDALPEEAGSMGLLRYAQPEDLEACISRLDAVKLLAALLDLEVTEQETAPFPDCEDLTSLEKGLIAAVYQAGIISGAGPSIFDPHRPLNNAQFVTMIWRSIGSPNGGGQGLGSWYSVAWQGLYQNNIFDGLSAPEDRTAWREALPICINALRFLQARDFIIGKRWTEDLVLEFDPSENTIRVVGDPIFSGADQVWVAYYTDQNQCVQIDLLKSGRDHSTLPQGASSVKLFAQATGNGLPAADVYAIPLSALR